MISLICAGQRSLLFPGSWHALCKFTDLLVLPAGELHHRIGGRNVAGQTSSSLCVRRDYSLTLCFDFFLDSEYSAYPSKAAGSEPAPLLHMTLMIGYGECLRRTRVSTCCGRIGTSPAGSGLVFHPAISPVSRKFRSSLSFAVFELCLKLSRPNIVSVRRSIIEQIGHIEVIFKDY